ncbi:MAG: hypothetical protein P8M72_13430 [Gammaproteobacteria bacterium]|nr:hypothetical protein [Gammaproteobacteria bacterium]
MRIILIVFLFSAPIIQAQDFWTAAELDALSSELSGRVGANNAAILGGLINHDGYSGVMVHRAPGPGFSEIHAEWADLYFITSGNASIATGGEILGAEESSPGEIRGGSIEGGAIRRIGKGDIVHIPAGVPHHVIVGEGEEVTYMIIKASAE